MPFEMPETRPDPKETAAVIERCGLAGRPFLLNPNGITTAKFYPQMRDAVARLRQTPRSEEHTSELQSLMRISYAVFCLQKKNKTEHDTSNTLLQNRSPNIYKNYYTIYVRTTK